MTLDALHDPRRNAVTVVRLVLALSVIVWHAVPLGGFTKSWPLADAAIGSKWGVDGFFVLSGFLVTAAWLRRPSLGVYLRHRALRLMPAYLVVLVVTAFVVAPWAWARQHGGLTGVLDAPLGPLRYVLANSLLVQLQEQIAGTPAGVPYPLVWNGSLWTLVWEAGAYLAVALLGVAGVLRARRGWVLAGAAALWAVVVVRAIVPSTSAAWASATTANHALRLGLMFAVGLVLCLYADRIAVDGRLALGAAALVAAAALWGNYLVVAPAFGYLLLWVCLRLPWGRGVRTDLSYGTYVYAFVVAQVLALLGAPAHGYIVFVALTVAGTLPLAAASWWLVEKPALSRKDPRGSPGRARASAAPG